MVQNKKKYETEAASVAICRQYDIYSTTSESKNYPFYSLVKRFKSIRPSKLIFSITTRKLMLHLEYTHKGNVTTCKNQLYQQTRTDKAISLQQHTMFFGGTGVRWRECDVIGRMCHRSSMNNTFLHSTNESRNLNWQSNKTSVFTHSETINITITKRAIIITH